MKFTNGLARVTRESVSTTVGDGSRILDENIIEIQMIPLDHGG